MLAIVAEAVETVQELNLLGELGGDAVQGDLSSRSLLPAEVRRELFSRTLPHRQVSCRCPCTWFKLRTRRPTMMGRLTAGDLQGA
jgi:hypothetical protein